MKYIKFPLAILICTALLCSALTITSLADEPPLWAGDVDLNSKVNAVDALKVCKYVLSPTKLTPEETLLYDLNQDDFITAEDAFLILHIAANNIKPWPIDKPFEKPTLPPAYNDGWQIIDDKKYYYKDGVPLKGWQTIEQFRYKFDENGVLGSKVGIDVSYAQGNIDWQKVKNAGVEFAMIRVGVRGYGTEGLMREDTHFQQNITGAKNAGLKVGVYFYSQAITNAEAKAEADFVIARIKNIKLDYPVAYDIEKAETRPGETGRTEDEGITKAQRTTFAITFCDTIKSAGFKTQIYSNKDWLENQLDLSRLKSYDIWLAHWTASTTNYTASPYTIWQYSDKGNVSGIQGNVDLNVSLVDY